MKTIPLFIILVVLLLLPNLTQARQTGVYFGGALGQSYVQTEISDIENNDLKLDENGFAFKVLAGVKMGPILALEGSYRSFGTVKSKVADINYESNITAYDLCALGRLDFRLFEIFAKAGYTFWDQTNTASALDFETSTSDANFSWGVGAAVKLGSMAVRAEWERFELQSFDRLSTLTLGLVFGL